MSPTFPADTDNVPVFSVGELSHAIKQVVEGAFSYVRVRGEISGLKAAPSGHIYLSLKDQQSVISAVCWRGVAARFAIAPEDGMEVIATGKITTYGGKSQYQLVIEALEPAGKGALMALLEKRKAQFAAEGLFAAERKKPLPFLPDVIGVITSPSGAVIRDILHRLRERFGRLVLLWPVLVQGDQAAKQIAEAISGFNNLKKNGDIVPRPDLLIVARGGGSIEDLWAFNEEIIVRAVAASKIPIISAIGHETDFTLIDYAADMRAPTPTAAAEIAVPVRLDLLLTVQQNNQRLLSSLQRGVTEAENNYRGIIRALPSSDRLFNFFQQNLDQTILRMQNSLPQRFYLTQMRFQTSSAALEKALPKYLLQAEMRLKSVLQGWSDNLFLQNIARFSERLSAIEKRLHYCITPLLENSRASYQQASRLLASVSYQNILSRGFALLRDDKGALIGSASMIKSEKNYQLEFHDGSLQIRRAEDKNLPQKKTSKNTKAPKTNFVQESLL